MSKTLKILAVAFVLTLLVVPAALAATGDVFIGNVKYTWQNLLLRSEQAKIEQILQAAGGNAQTAVKIEYEGGKIYTLETVADALKSRQSGQSLQAALASKTTTTAPANPIPPDQWVAKSVSVALGNTASGIGKVATVGITGYTDVASYRLLKSDNTPLTNKVNVGSTVVVMFLAAGDSCKVELYKADGTLVDTKSVTAAAAGGGQNPGGQTPSGDVTVTLGNTASGIGKVATVGITGYTDVATYRLLKSDNTPLTNKVNVGSTVVVMFLAAGDSCKVELYKADGTLLDTKSVTATAAGGGQNPGGQTPSGNVTVTLGNTASGIGKVATVGITGYTDVATYRLLKSDNTPLTNKVNVGSTVVVMFLAAGDSCKVELYKADGTLIDTKSVVVN